MIDTLKQIDEYFKGTRKKFTVKTATVGTLFQMKIWNSMSKIPYGKTNRRTGASLFTMNRSGSVGAGARCTSCDTNAKARRIVASNERPLGLTDKRRNATQQGDRNANQQQVFCLRRHAPGRRDTALRPCARRRRWQRSWP